VRSLVGNLKNVFFVDTGWSGSTQYFLMKAFPNIKWHGLYFGKWDTWRENPPHFDSISGISVEGTSYTHKQPETAIFFYHHIIEAPLEPDFPSVEHLIRDPFGNICSYRGIDEKKILPQKNEPIFSGICRFFDSNVRITSADISEMATSAFRKLENKIIFPSREDTAVLTVGPRSADFGKKKLVPILHCDKIKSKFDLTSKIRGVKKSIWRQGKIVEEFPYFYPIILCFYNKLPKFSKFILNSI
jgi:hypothetical protein